MLLFFENFAFEGGFTSGNVGGWGCLTVGQIRDEEGQLALFRFALSRFGDFFQHSLGHTDNQCRILVLLVGLHFSNEAQLKLQLLVAGFDFDQLLDLTIQLVL